MRVLICVFLFAALAERAPAQSCTYTVSPTTASVAGDRGTSGSITVTMNQEGCPLSATATETWITITAVQPTGPRSGTVSWSVAANPTLAQRSGQILIGNAAFTITQAPGVCTFTLSSSSASFSAAGGTGSFSVSTQSFCAWTAASNADWVTITSGAATGAGTVTYTVAPNSTASARTASIAVGTQTFNVNQAAPCVLSFNPASASFPASGGAGTITVTASASSCDRSAVSDSSWLTITSGATGTGSGTIAYSVAPNNTSQTRTATITIGGQRYTVTQAAGGCTFLLTPASRTLPASGGSGSFTVTTTCAWTAVSSHPDWLQVISGSSGTGSGTVTYTALPNGSAAPRLGWITVGDQVFNVTQLGASCAVTLTPAQVVIAAEGGSGSIEISAAPGCTWTAASTASWISVLPPAGGEGDGTVRFTVAANSAPQARTGAITVGGQVFSITQQGAACTYSLSVTTVTVPATGGAGSVDISTACSWTATPSAPWITITSSASGTGNGTVNFAVAANTGPSFRSATILIGDRTLTVTQAGTACAVTLTPAEAGVPGVAGTGSFRVSAATGCTWTPVSRADWIQIVSWSSVSGSGLVNYSYASNPSPSPRTGMIEVDGQVFRLNQGPAEVRVSAVVNAASASAGPLAPGLIITIAGLGLGPASGVAADALPVGTQLAETRVLFDETPAPVLYASDTQVNAIAPYALEGKTRTELVVEYRGVRSAPLALEVAPAAPGIFTLDCSGHGQGAILNQDYSVNGPANAAARNAIVILYATGEGQTKPPGADGAPPGETLPRPVLPVTVEIGGVEAPVLYAGGAPGMAAGVMQVNVRIPARAPVGPAVPVRLRVGNYQSQPGVTMAIK